MNDYRSELKEAEVVLQNLISGLERMREVVAKQKRRVAALTELANIEEDSSPPTGLVSGVTDAVRTVFLGAEKALSPAEVCQRVKSLGLPPQKNLLASVYTVIRRLLDSKEIEKSTEGYQWNISRKGQFDTEASNNIDAIMRFDSAKAKEKK